jgi:demethoxyubiquinone hydroxylase (CLK1/Coq7/Cat5 family)
MSNMAPTLSVFFERELRSDHAGEIGAVSIYDGIVAIVLLRCQADEQHHRDQAAALGGDLPNQFIHTWCWVVSFGSKVAVALARRL